MFRRKACLTERWLPSAAVTCVLLTHASLAHCFSTFHYFRQSSRCTVCVRSVSIAILPSRVMLTHQWLKMLNSGKCNTRFALRQTVLQTNRSRTGERYLTRLHRRFKIGISIRVNPHQFAHPSHPTPNLEVRVVQKCGQVGESRTHFHSKSCFRFGRFSGGQPNFLLGRYYTLLSFDAF